MATILIFREQDKEDLNSLFTAADASDNVFNEKFMKEIQGGIKLSAGMLRRRGMTPYVVKMTSASRFI